MTPFFKKHVWLRRGLLLVTLVPLPLLWIVVVFLDAGAAAGSAVSGFGEELRARVSDTNRDARQLVRDITGSMKR